MLLTACDVDRLPSIKLRTTRRINGDCLATIMTLGGGLKRRKNPQQEVGSLELYSFQPALKLYRPTLTIRTTAATGVKARIHYTSFPEASL